MEVLALFSFRSNFPQSSSVLQTHFIDKKKSTLSATWYTLKREVHPQNYSKLPIILNKVLWYSRNVILFSNYSLLLDRTNQKSNFSKNNHLEDFQIQDYIIHVFDYYFLSSYFFICIHTFLFFYHSTTYYYHITNWNLFFDLLKIETTPIRLLSN